MSQLNAQWTFEIHSFLMGWQAFLGHGYSKPNRMKNLQIDQIQWFILVVKAHGAHELSIKHLFYDNNIHLFSIKLFGALPFIPEQAWFGLSR